MRSHIRLFALTLTLVVAHALAEELRDPTRPPLAEGPKVAVGTPRVALNELRSIRIDARGPLAIIDGKAVKVGDVVGEGRVKAIRDYEVELSTPAGVHILKLYPGVQKLAREPHIKAVTNVAQANKATQVMTTGEKAP